MNKQYLSWLYNIICSLEIETNNIIKLHLKGTILELICCLEDNNFIMYDDIDSNYKIKYNMKIYDDGIDIIDINNNIIGQCKYFKPYSTISNHILGTFLKYVINLRKFNFKNNLYLSENVKVDEIDYINKIIISEDKINYWINKAKEYHNNFINKKILNYKKEDIKLYNYQNEVLYLMNNTNKEINYYNIFCG